MEQNPLLTTCPNFGDHLKMQKPDLLWEYMTSSELMEWAAYGTNLNKSKDIVTDHDIAKLIRWIGWCAADTIFTGEGKPILGRIGIGLMLTVTLLEFPEYYMKHGLAQFN
jgi:hypothetical protein